MINKPWISLPVVYSRPFASKAFFLSDFEGVWVCHWLFLIMEGQGWNPCLKGSSTAAIFPPQNRIVLLSNFVAKRLKDSRLSLYLPIENPSKRHGASSQRKLKSHSIRMAGMRSKIHTCQPETVLLIASFWLDALLNNKHLPSLL